VQVRPEVHKAEPGGKAAGWLVLPRRGVQGHTLESPHRIGPFGHGSGPMSTTPEVRMRLDTSLVRSGGQAHAAADRNRTPVLKGSSHRDALLRVDAPILEVRAEHVRIRPIHADCRLVLRGRHRAHKRWADPGALDRSHGGEDSRESLEHGGICDELAAERFRATHGLKLGDQGRIEIVPEPPEVPFGGTPEEQAGRRLAARLVHGNEAATAILREERGDVQPHQFPCVHEPLALFGKSNDFGILLRTELLAPECEVQAEWPGNLLPTASAENPS
jgi:hypothetical protein